LIERWLASVVRTTGLDWALGFEVAQCGRLIKGYGSTNERGKDNLLHIIDHLAQQNSPVTERTAAVAAARAAALADDAGQALDRTLVQHGAPARPVKEHPVRFVRKPKQTV
jgi:indolepyruvate ferredoxin oxidoreductase beta subunit